MVFSSFGMFSAIYINDIAHGFGLELTWAENIGHELETVRQSTSIRTLRLIMESTVHPGGGPRFAYKGSLITRVRETKRMITELIFLVEQYRVAYDAPARHPGVAGVEHLDAFENLVNPTIACTSPCEQATVGPG
jgi:hypothetical protein